MDCHCLLDPEAKAWPGPETERCPPNPPWHPLCVEDRRTSEDIPPAYGSPATCWRRLSAWSPHGDLGADWAHAVEPTRCPKQTGVGTSLPRREFRAGEKRRAGVGETKIGKGSKGMVVADRHCLPISLYMDSAHPHESQLADATLASVRVPQKRGRRPEGTRGGPRL